MLQPSASSSGFDSTPAAISALIPLTTVCTSTSAGCCPAACAACTTEETLASSLEAAPPFSTLAVSTTAPYVGAAPEASGAADAVGALADMVVTATRCWTEAPSLPSSPPSPPPPSALPPFADDATARVLSVSSGCMISVETTEPANAAT
eukprot:scaffold80708_cov75-Phaeocystis_antarctica.AAC.14